MLTLYKFGPAFGVPDASPFCVKLETYLRMTGLEFQVEKGAQNLKRSPKGKMPFIVHDGTTIGDSELVIDYLKKTFGDTLDAHLSAEQKALALLVQRTLDEHCYFGMVYSRWIDDTNWPLVRDAFFRTVPGLLRGIVSGVVRKGIAKALHGQGTGRHAPSDIYAMAVADLKAVIALLGDKDFFFGDTPSSIDAVIFSYFVNGRLAMVVSPMRDYLNSEPRVAAYCERMYARFYPEWKHG